ncbi:MAG: envelope stress response membrane protein PspB [Pseudomonadota bacterium]
MDGMVVAFFVPTLVFIIFVLPLWLFMHYRTKQRTLNSLTEAERDDLKLMAVNAERMLERIATLEALLDEEAPDWRSSADAAVNGRGGARPAATRQAMNGERA